MHRSRKRRLASSACWFLCVLAACLPGQARAATMLDVLRSRGVLVCGLFADQAGMSLPDGRNRMVGFHADICRAIAVAVFGDPEKVRFQPVTVQARFTALQSGEIDILQTTTALTLRRDSTLGLTTPAATFYTGQGFLVNRRTGARSVADLNGATVCALQGSEVERNVQDYASGRGLRLSTVAFDSMATVMSSFLGGRCDAISNDMVSLATSLVGVPNREQFELLPDIIAKEPHGPMVRADDLQWATLVRWVVFALIQAEEMGLTQANVEEQRAKSTDPKVLRFLGKADNVGQGFGISDDWAYEVIRRIGNYGELYDRYVGKNGLGLDRGPNRLWTDGGVMVSWLWQ